MLKTLLLLVALTAVCPVVIRAQAVPAAGAADPSLYPGDAVKVMIWQEPDLSGTYRVDKDGTLTLPLLGQRSVAGLTADQLRASLLQDYAYHLKNPSIEVSVLRRVSVLGHVQKPGMYDLEPTMRVGDVVALAGGITPQGNPKNIEFYRDGQQVGGDLEMGSVIGDRVRAGDQIVVKERSWFSQNSSRILVGLGTTVAFLLIRRGF